MEDSISVYEFSTIMKKRIDDFLLCEIFHKKESLDDTISYGVWSERFLLWEEEKYPQCLKKNVELLKEDEEDATI